MYKEKEFTKEVKIMESPNRNAKHIKVNMRDEIPLEWTFEMSE